eukprot:1156398-Pelagomonas_calceolata.AAC.10
METLSACSSALLQLHPAHKMILEVTGSFQKPQNHFRGQKRTAAPASRSQDQFKGHSFVLKATGLFQRPHVHRCTCIPLARSFQRQQVRRCTCTLLTGSFQRPAAMRRVKCAWSASLVYVSWVHWHP